MINLNNKKSRKFISIVKNTIEDLKQNVECDMEVLSYLKDIVKTKSLTLINVQGLYQVIESRKLNLDYIRLIQDKYSFDLVNEEHRYIEKFLSQYFDSSNLQVLDIDSKSLHFSGSLTYKEEIENNRKVG